MTNTKNTASKGTPIDSGDPSEGLSDGQKDHYFELAMRSYSNGVLNQEVILVREFARTPGELTLKHIGFSKSAAVPIVQAVVVAMDEMSGAYQKIGEAELLALLQGDGQ